MQPDGSSESRPFQLIPRCHIYSQRLSCIYLENFLSDDTLCHRCEANTILSHLGIMIPQRVHNIKQIIKEIDKYEYRLDKLRYGAKYGW